MSDKRRKDGHDRSDSDQEDSRTMELDKYALLNKVGRDTKSGENATIKMPAVVTDSRPTIPMTAVDMLTKPDIDATALALVELEVEMEPIDEDRIRTTQIPVRLEFSAVVEPGGIVRIPKKMLDSGHIRPGMHLKLIAMQKA